MKVSVNAKYKSSLPSSGPVGTVQTAFRPSAGLVFTAVSKVATFAVTVTSLMRTMRTMGCHWAEITQRTSEGSRIQTRIPQAAKAPWYVA